MVKSIIIIGFNGNAFELADSLLRSNEYELTGFVDDDPSLSSNTYAGVPILGNLSTLNNFTSSNFAFCIGSSKSYLLRESLFGSLNRTSERFPTLIHPTALVSPSAKIGFGVIIGPYCVIGAHATIAPFTIVLSHCVISHHSKVADFSVIAAGTKIAGHATVGKSCYIGGGVTIRDGITIGEKCLIGMGSVVVKDFPSNKIICGNPAREMSC